jgi:hypothetical protein
MKHIASNISRLEGNMFAMKIFFTLYICLCGVTADRMMATTTRKKGKVDKTKSIVTLGPRPYFLIDSMEPSDLKEKLGKSIMKTAFHCM